MKETEKLTIQPLSFESIPFVNHANDPFPIIGRIVPQFSGTTWSYTEELYETATETRSLTIDSIGRHISKTRIESSSSPFPALLVSVTFALFVTGTVSPISKTSRSNKRFVN